MLTRDLRAQLDQQIAELDRHAIAADVATTTSLDVDESRRQLDMYLGEAAVALALVEPHLRTDARILEIGSGIGWFAAFLARAGFDVTALEPAGIGFEFIGAARNALEIDHPNLSHLDIGVENLDPDLHGTYDLVYSLNVLEHVPDWSLALERATSVLAPGGMMVQSCPNYTFPFDPHFGVPLVPGAPAITGRLLPRRITDSGLWQSLNWVTARDVERWADDAGYPVRFRRGKLADAVERLSTDVQFSARHGRIGRIVAATAGALRLDTLLRAVPPQHTSPMEFEITRPTRP